jgi:transcriptional regulator with XRE-family HTH domain
MVQRFQSYLRPLRRRWGFTQGELAFLIGYETGKSISRIEALQQTPTFNAALSCAVIFNTAPVKLFPGALSDAEQLVLARASQLYDELQGDPSKVTRIKLDFLEVLLARLESKRAARL